MGLSVHVSVFINRMKKKGQHYSRCGRAPPQSWRQAVRAGMLATKSSVVPNSRERCSMFDEMF